MAKKNEKTIRITQIRSGIGRPEKHRRVLKGMGLGKFHGSVHLPDTPETRGMINKVCHLVKLEE